MNTNERKIKSLLYNTPKNTAVYVLLKYADEYIHNQTENTKDVLTQQYYFTKFVYEDELTNDIKQILTELLN